MHLLDAMTNNCVHGAQQRFCFKQWFRRIFAIKENTFNKLDLLYRCKIYDTTKSTIAIHYINPLKCRITVLINMHKEIFLNYNCFKMFHKKFTLNKYYNYSSSPCYYYTAE